MSPLYGLGVHKYAIRDRGFCKLCPMCGRGSTRQRYREEDRDQERERQIERHREQEQERYRKECHVCVLFALGVAI